MASCKIYFKDKLIFILQKEIPMHPQRTMAYYNVRKFIVCTRVSILYKHEKLYTIYSSIRYINLTGSCNTLITEKQFCRDMLLLCTPIFLIHIVQMSRTNNFIKFINYNFFFWKNICNLYTYSHIRLSYTMSNKF